MPAAPGVCNHEHVGMACSLPQSDGLSSSCVFFRLFSVLTGHRAKTLCPLAPEGPVREDNPRHAVCFVSMRSVCNSPWLVRFRHQENCPGTSLLNPPGLGNRFLTFLVLSIQIWRSNQGMAWERIQLYHHCAKFPHTSVTVRVLAKVSVMAVGSYNLNGCTYTELILLCKWSTGHPQIKWLLWNTKQWNEEKLSSTLHDLVQINRNIRTKSRLGKMMNDCFTFTKTNPLCTQAGHLWCLRDAWPSHPLKTLANGQFYCKQHK